MKRLYNYLPIVLSCFCIAILLSVGFLFDMENSSVWVEEDGIIETLSAVGYFLCILFMVFKGGLAYLNRYYYFFLLILVFALRELDFHSKFTTMGILKTYFYISDTVPIYEKIIGLVVIVLIISLVSTIANKHSRRFFRELRQKTPLALSISLVFLTLVLSKSLDGIRGKLSALGVVTGPHFSANMRLIEETLELGIPLLIMTSLHLYFSQENGQ
ncbi:MAG: hypothetical protein CSB23_02010 [Deltaproteobacteria bacterium]|nr:MAG: hypothetical protein CSB23_02010 [Deltaproteobacteria bacterium]